MKGLRAGFLLLLLLGGCADRRHRLVVSIPDQRMLVFDGGRPVAVYRVSTSKYGTGDREGSYATPTGRFRVRCKIGDGAPSGAVFHSRKPTGEVIAPDAPGRDPIVTRILWLDGLEPHNRNAFARDIYIHGTPQEALLGIPVSYGCIRMSSRDIIRLYDLVGNGTLVEIIRGTLPASP
jgi:lipoprotein-anchoring transpeptidase ErfK/SrfK